MGEFAFRHWSDPKADHKYAYDESPEHDLFALKTGVGSTKGGYPPGFSIEPNVLMHTVARREGRADAERHLAAAVRQAEWIVRELDWADPRVTKGQRVSEFITMTGLAHLLAEHPERAPAGLREKIEEWAKVVVRRSANLWDFRKHGDGPTEWVPTGEKPTMWNEVGNVAGLPAAIMAARTFVRDEALATRLEQIAWAHLDAVFGRNPTGRHFGFAAPKELEGVERGWFSRYRGGIGQLEGARFVLDGAPKNAHYPYNPELGNLGWTEGWIQHNTPLNVSLAYLARTGTRLTARVEAGRLQVALRAPLNFDHGLVETAEVLVTSSAGVRSTLVVTESGPNSEEFTGVLDLAPAGPVAAGEERLRAPGGGTVTVSYGYGYLGHSVVCRVE